MSTLTPTTHCEISTNGKDDSCITSFTSSCGKDGQLQVDNVLPGKNEQRVLQLENTNLSSDKTLQSTSISCTTSSTSTITTGSSSSPFQDNNTTSKRTLYFKQNKITQHSKPSIYPSQISLQDYEAKITSLLGDDLSEGDAEEGAGIKEEPLTPETSDNDGPTISKQSRLDPSLYLQNPEIPGRGSASPSSTSPTAGLLPTGSGDINTTAVFGLLGKLLQIAEENRQHILDVKKDILQIKLALQPQLTPEESREVYDVLPKPFSSVESFTEFCAQLEDPTYRKMVVAFFSAVPAKDPGDLCRKCLDKLMTNQLMLKYNVHGRGLKGKMPISDFPRLIDVFCNAVRNNWNEAENVHQAVHRALGDHLKGAKRRFDKESHSCLEMTSQAVYNSPLP